MNCPRCGSPIKKELGGCVVCYPATFTRIPEPFLTDEELITNAEVALSEALGAANREIERLRAENKERDYWKNEWTQVCEKNQRLWQENKRLENELHQMGDSRNTLEHKLEQVNKRLNNVIRTVSMQREVIRHACGERESLRSELVEKDKVLEWYADKDVWFADPLTSVCKAQHDDNGKRARSILVLYRKTAPDAD